jgi:hypothetical protein
MKIKLISLLLAAGFSAALANTAPTPVVVSAAMRPGTAFMDVVYQVNDPDDATVKVRALAFINGTRSFANVIRPVTFVEGTGANLGDAITTNTPHTLTWNVAADWNIDLGNVKFEILARDGRGLLDFDWISIPAAAGKPALTISKDTPSNAMVLNAFFWQYADADPALTLSSGVLTANANSGVFSGLVMASGATLQTYSIPYLLKQMNLDSAYIGEVSYAATTARAGLLNTTKWHAAQRPYAGLSIVVGWGYNQNGSTTIPAGLTGVTAIVSSLGSGSSFALKSDGTVVGWGPYYDPTIPAGLTGATAIAAGDSHYLAIKSDGTVVAWGENTYGQTTIPAGLTGVTAIAGFRHSLALKSDGTVVAWGNNTYGQTTIPAGLTGVTAIAAGIRHSLALKSDGTVVAWGDNTYGQTTIPAGLTGVTAISDGGLHSLALKNNGTVVAWGYNQNGSTTIPAGLTGVTAIAAGNSHSLALKSDGTVVAWGSNSSGQTTIPAGLTGVTAIAAGSAHSLALKATAQ